MLGSGGMGAVFEAHHLELKRPAAIKVLRSAYARDPEINRRFMNEALAANRIRHPSIIEVIDIERLPDGSLCLIMELLAGATLGQRVADSGGRVTVATMLRWGWQIADALAAAHKLGIIHRDIKPSNIMLVRDAAMPDGERVKVLDFGIAKLAFASGPQPITECGRSIGTPQYMAPEQFMDARLVTGKADVYSLGVIFFEMLTGKPLFSADNVLALMYMNMNNTIPALTESRERIPAALASLVPAMLAKNPEHRPSMGTLAEVLKELLQATKEPESSLRQGAAVGSEMPPLPNPLAPDRIAAAGNRQRPAEFSSRKIEILNPNDHIPAEARSDKWIWRGLIASTIIVMSIFIIEVWMLSDQR